MRGGEADEAIQGARDRGWIASSSARNDNAGFAPARVRGAAFGLLLLIFAQIYLGALVAGLHAGLIYNTWPLIDGGLVPSLERLMLLTPAWRNLFENVLTVQFAHRMVAYLLWTASIVHALDVARTDRRGPEFLGAVLLAVAVTVQAVLGILTLLHQVPIGLALAHQGMAMVVLTIAVVHAARSQGLRPAILGWRSDPGLVRRSRIMPPATPGPGRR